ncbi:hypothetical protein [Leptolyngbya sp. BC1307]|uniref:hypothetical protein n=1 Tax=Leptolyngbya sp. BC1307 TaxID=2029589 RepID=UPI000EFD18B5|nr:hypothetical protein [Leptolyngbya sp. BC1307]
MTFFQRSRRWLTALALVLLLTVTTGCATATREAPTGTNIGYEQLQRGNSTAGQTYGDWVVSAAQGLISDAYVRDNDKLGVVISDSVRPSEVKDLSRSLLQGFRQSFPDKDLKVLVYAPDKELILQANYDSQTRQVEYEQPA